MFLKFLQATPKEAEESYYMYKEHMQILWDLVGSISDPNKNKREALIPFKSMCLLQQYLHIQKRNRKSNQIQAFNQCILDYAIIHAFIYNLHMMVDCRNYTWLVQRINM